MANISAIFDFSKAKENAAKGDVVSQIYEMEEEVRDLQAKIEDCKDGLTPDDQERMNSMYTALNRRDALLNQQMNRLADSVLGPKESSSPFSDFDSLFR